MDLEEVVLRAGTAYSEGRYEEALQLYRRAVLVHPTNAVLHANIAAILSRLNRHEDALYHAEQAVSLQPKWGKASYRKGEALRSLGDSRAALMAFCTSLRYESPTKQCLIALKDCASRVFPAFPAGGMEKLGLQDDPFALLATIGQLYLSEGSYLESIKLLTWSLQLDCSCQTLKASALSCLGTAQFKSGSPNRAVDYFEQQLEICKELGGNELPVLRNIAMACEAAHEWELALGIRRQILVHKSLDQQDKDNERQSIAELLLQMGRGEEAFFLLEMKTPENLRARVNLACARAYTGEGASALPSLLPLRPADEALFARAVAAVSRCLGDEGRFQEAVDYLEGIMKHSAVKGQNLVWKKACSLCCRVHLRMGNDGHALELAKRLLRTGRNRGDVEAEVDGLRLLAELYEQQGDYTSAVVLLQNCATLLISSVERAKLYFEVARITQKSGADAREHLEAAVAAAECTSDSQVKTQAFSQALRFYKENGQVAEAETFLQRQKDLLHYDLDGTSRSVIFEDLAFMSAEEGGSQSSVMVLEHSLAEAQEANNIHRELELLEKLGDELTKSDRLKEAEGFYQRFLALGKQLRAADMIRRGHEKLAEEYRRREEWNLCLEHARSGLTLAKLQHDMKGRIGMCLLIGFCEIQKSDLDTAVYVLKKAETLSAAVQMTPLEEQAHKLLAQAFDQQGNEREAAVHHKKFAALSTAPSTSLCSALLSIARRAEPAEAVCKLKKCRDIAQNLDEGSKSRHLLDCFSMFLDLNLTDEAISCLDGSDMEIGSLDCLFERSLKEQLPILMHLNETTAHHSAIHGRLLLLQESQTCYKTATCSLISCWRTKNWQKVLDWVGEGSTDLEVISSETLELMGMVGDWHLNRTLPESLLDLSEEHRLFLHSISWVHPAWLTVPLSRTQIYDGRVDLLSEDLTLLDKIVCAVLSGQKELVPMWFEELLDTMRRSDFTPFDWDNPRKDVLLAAAFVALAEEDPVSQLWILERAKWELDKQLLSGYAQSQPGQVSALLFTAKLSYLYSLEEVDLVWIWEDDTLKVHLSRLAPSLSFHVHLLSKYLRHKGVGNLDLSQENAVGLLVTNQSTNIPARRVVPWIREATEGKSPNRRNWLLSLSSIVPKGAVSCLDCPRSLALSKFPSSHVAIIDPEAAPSLHELIATAAAPDVVLCTGRLPFELYTAFLLMGTAVVVEVEKPTLQSVHIFVDQLRTGDPVRICASHLKHRIVGDADFRVESDATLGQLRKIIREDAESFLVLARSWRQDGRQDEPWTAVARGLLTLSDEQRDRLIPLIDEYHTDLVNELASREEFVGEWEPLNDPCVKEQFRLLYEDHLLVDKKRV